MKLTNRQEQALARHRARDPHCTCNDCIDHFDKMTIREDEGPKAFVTVYRRTDGQVWLTFEATVFQLARLLFDWQAQPATGRIVVQVGQQRAEWTR